MCQAKITPYTDTVLIINGEKIIHTVVITHKNLNGFSFVTITNYETFVGQRKIYKVISIWATGLWL